MFDWNKQRKRSSIVHVCWVRNTFIIQFSIIPNNYLSILCKSSGCCHRNFLFVVLVHALGNCTTCTCRPKYWMIKFSNSMVSSKAISFRLHSQNWHFFAETIPAKLCRSRMYVGKLNNPHSRKTLERKSKLKGKRTAIQFLWIDYKYSCLCDHTCITLCV